MDYTEQELAQLIFDLTLALTDHHLGLDTTRPFAETYRRDERLTERALNTLTEVAPELAAAFDALPLPA